jgi:hypothetical protein
VSLRPFRQAGLGGFNSTISVTNLKPGVVILNPSLKFPDC